MYTPVHKPKAQNSKLLMNKKTTAKEISSAVFTNNGISLTTAPQSRPKHGDKKEMSQRARSAKLMERKEPTPVKSATPIPQKTNVVSSNFSLNKVSSAQGKLTERRKQQVNAPTSARNVTPTPRNRTINRNTFSMSKELQPRKEVVEIGIQTNKAEILNHELIIGDIKYMMPSRNIVIDIERERREAKKRALLKVKRKFEEHSEKQEQHLTDLKDFLEKACVTRRSRKPREALEMDKKLMQSMDEFFAKEMPKAESITNIKERIKRKELELLKLFDSVETFNLISDHKN